MEEPTNDARCDTCDWSYSKMASKGKNDSQGYSKEEDKGQVTGKGVARGNEDRSGKSGRQIVHQNQDSYHPRTYLHHVAGFGVEPNRTYRIQVDCMAVHTNYLAGF